MNNNIIKKYTLIIAVFSVFLTGFIFFEKNDSQYSLTINQTKSLNEKSVHILKQLINEKAVKFEIFTQKDSVVAQKIKQYFNKFRRVNNQILLEFIDPLTQPSKLKDNAITMQGEIVLTHVDESQLSKVHITELSESAIINAIIKLQNNDDEWMVFAEGYGMKSVEDDTTEGLSKLLVNLKKKGYQIARMPLDVSLILPDNVKVLVLPAPTEVLDSQIVEWLHNQLEQGKSIWWLTDVNTVPQPHLELMFDVMIGSKILLDKNEYSGFISEFPSNPITENFNQPIYLAEAIEVKSSEYSSLIKTLNQSNIAVSKQLNTSRIIITGDANFITNQYINNVANESFSLRSIDWLFTHDDRVNIPVQINSNTQLYLTQTQLLALSVFFLILIPLFFLIMAWKQWRAKNA
jgi:hypothetical protein